MSERPATPLDLLRQLCPEQMKRDPSGLLADMTYRALQASEGHHEQVRYVHARKGRNCMLGTLALAGYPPGFAWPLFVAPMRGYRPVATSPFEALLSPAPPGASVTDSGRGLTWPDGFIGLVVEPDGFASPPATFPVRCGTCAQTGAILRTRVINDLRTAEAGTRKITPVAIDVV